MLTAKTHVYLKLLTRQELRITQGKLHDKSFFSVGSTSSDTISTKADDITENLTFVETDSIGFL